MFLFFVQTVIFYEEIPKLVNNSSTIENIY